MDGFGGVLRRIILDDARGFAAHGDQTPRLGGALVQQLGDLAGVMRIEHPSVDARLHEFRPAAVELRAEDRLAARHRLWDDQAPVVLERRHDQAISGGVVACDLLVLRAAGEDHTWDVLLADDRFERLALGAFADEDEGAGRVRAREEFPSREQFAETFERNQATDVEEQRPGRCAKTQAAGNDFLRRQSRAFRGE